MEPRMLVKHVIKTDFPQMFKGKKPQKIPVVIRGTEKNSWTVAPSFVHAADMTDADYVLFLEKDFEIPESVRCVPVYLAARRASDVDVALGNQCSTTVSTCGPSY